MGALQTRLAGKGVGAPNVYLSPENGHVNLFGAAGKTDISGLRFLISREVTSAAVDNRCKSDSENSPVKSFRVVGPNILYVRIQDQTCSIQPICHTEKRLRRAWCPPLLHTSKHLDAWSAHLVYYYYLI